MTKLQEAHYNVFLLDADDCMIDLLTDSGTGAMSARQWAGMMLGDESYAGSRSWKKFKHTVQTISGKKHIFPTHQGRAAESLLALTQVKPGHIIPNNSHFDTTRANMEFAGAEAIDLICDEASDLAKEFPFKGNMHLEKLETVLKSHQDQIPFVMLTVTNNTGGGQPVSMSNLREVRSLVNKFGVPLVLDACRFAENAFFIKTREDDYQDKELLEIAQEMFSQVDAATMSLKKDGLVNIGGFFVCDQDKWADDFKNALILREGFPTYGGLAGRDLEACSIGLLEALSYDYQEYRHATIDYMLNKLIEADIPVVRPAGGHAVFLDAKRFLPHVSPEHFPAISLVNALFVEGGIRSVGLGSLMFGRYDDHGTPIPAAHELVRMAFPRRVYTQSHFDYMVEVVMQVWEKRDQLAGYEIEHEPPFLRHFSAHLRPVK